MRGSDREFRALADPRQGPDSLRQDHLLNPRRPATINATKEYKIPAEFLVPFDASQLPSLTFRKQFCRSGQASRLIPGSAQSEPHARTRARRVSAPWGGHDTAAAERLTATFLDLMTKLTMHRDTLEREAEERSRSEN
jgi:hypothetical protein